MLELYVDGLPVDEELADRVWEAWNVQLICEDKARAAWAIITATQMSAHVN
jgi:hypothetical protein